MDDSDGQSLIVIKSTASNGLGVFATRDILRGCRIVAESALLELPSDNGNAAEILHAFEALPLPRQEDYLALHAYACDSFKRAVERELGQQWEGLSKKHRQVLAIFAANAFGNVYMMGSRMNHSCIPNVHFAYNPTIKRETFHAIRDINANEELTIMYIKGVNRTRSQRQAELDKWGFLCKCPACEKTKHGKRREVKRAQLFSLDQELALNSRLGTDKAWRKCLELAQKMAAIQKSEGLVSRELAVTYHDAAKSCYKTGNVQMTLLWAEKELETDRFCVGDDHPDVVQQVEIVERLKAIQQGAKQFDQAISDWFASSDASSDACVTM